MICERRLHTVRSAQRVPNFWMLLYVSRWEINTISTYAWLSRVHRYEHFSISRYCTVSVLMNHLHAYSHFWRTLLPSTSYSLWLTCLACEVTGSHVPWLLLWGHMKDMVYQQKSQTRELWQLQTHSTILIHTSFISNYCTKLSFWTPTCFGHLLQPSSGSYEDPSCVSYISRPCHGSGG
jgi:hypothetical protein